MPTYEYRCNQCNSVFSVITSIWPKKKTKCPCCGSEDTGKIIPRTKTGAHGLGGHGGPFC